MTTIITNTHKRIAMALAFAGLLSACKVGKNYQRPELPLPQQVCRHSECCELRRYE
jgi:hypothetical protein